MIIGGLFTIHAYDGFAIWSKGSGCARELHYTELKDMTPGETKVAVKKGPGADIWPVISYDGVWIAFGRAIKVFKARYGQCDYHQEESFDLYIAKIDNGKNLPAEAIKISHGYWPSWSEDAKFPDKDKTLYFSHIESKSIMKTIIKPNGSFSTPVKYADVTVAHGPVNHTQVSPDGRYTTVRGSRLTVIDLQTSKVVSGAGGGGCHPCWGPRGKYLIWASNNVCKIENGIGKGLGKAGLGKYWYGISNDAYYDEGNLWVIGRCGSRGDQNSEGSVCFREVDISGGGYKYSNEAKTIGSGNATDIHVFPPDGPPRPTSIQPRTNQTIGGGTVFNTQITKSASGLQLIIKSEELSSGYSATLYDVQGKLKIFMNISSSSKHVLPLNYLADGRYILKIGNKNVSVQKSIVLSR